MYIHIIYYFTLCRAIGKRIPFSDLINPVSKKNKDNHKEHYENFELPLCLQDVALPATGVSEFERAWVVNDKTEKRREAAKGNC